MGKPNGVDAFAEPWDAEAPLRIGDSGSLGSHHHHRRSREGGYAGAVQDDAHQSSPFSFEDGLTPLVLNPVHLSPHLPDPNQDQLPSPSVIRCQSRVGHPDPPLSDDPGAVGKALEDHPPTHRIIS